MSSYSGESEEPWSPASFQGPGVPSFTSSPPQQVPNSCLLTELLNSVGITSDDSTESPFLKIIEQPQNHYKFRYWSEMENPHGCLYGKTYEGDKTVPRTYPEVELFNYDGKATIKCELVQCDNDYEHPHTLCVNDSENIKVEVPLHGNYRVRFTGLCIIRRKRKYVVEWLIRGHNVGDASPDERIAIQRRCANMAKIINLNTVRLKFSAVDLHGVQLCDPIYSDPIHSKSGATNVLKICRISHASGRARGGDDVIVLVEKVVKRNIMIRIFEKSEEGDITWSENGIFSDSNVHYQHAITFRTPAYRDLEISSRVKVFIELVRPSDGERSKPVEFFYTPEPIYHRCKKRKLSPTGDQENISVASGIGIHAASCAPIAVLQQPLPTPCSPPVATPAAAASAQGDDGLDKFMSIFADFSTEELFPEFESLMNEVNSDDQMSSDSGRGQSKNNCTAPEKLPIKKIESTDDCESNRDQAIIQKMRKQVQTMLKLIRYMDASKKEIIIKALEALFDIRLSNGDTFLHLILGSKQPLLDYVINLIHDSGMVHLLNLRNTAMQTILHLAVVNNQPELIPMLLSKGCDPMLEDIDGNNVIHYGVMHQDCLDSVLEAIKSSNSSCNLDACNNEKQTALHLAVIYKSESSARKLVCSGASYNTRDGEGRTPLHLAAYDDCLPVLAALLDHVLPEDIDEVDSRGFTTLQIICEKEIKDGSLEIINILLDKKANPLMKSESRGVTAWGLAREKPALRDLMRTRLPEEPSSDSESEDEFESADEGDFCDPDDELSDLSQPLNKLSIGVASKEGSTSVSE